MSELLEWLVEGCQKLKHGQCTTRRCVVRGGYSGSGGYDPEIATCEEKELADMLADRDRLAARVRELERICGYAMTVRSQNTPDWMIQFAKLLNAYDPEAPELMFNGDFIEAKGADHDPR